MIIPIKHPKFVLFYEHDTVFEDQSYLEYKISFEYLRIIYFAHSMFLYPNFNFFNKSWKKIIASMFLFQNNEQ